MRKLAAIRGRLGSGGAGEVANAWWRFDGGHVSSRGGPLPRPSVRMRILLGFRMLFMKGEVAGLSVH